MSKDILKNEFDKVTELYKIAATTLFESKEPNKLQSAYAIICAANDNLRKLSDILSENPIINFSYFNIAFGAAQNVIETALINDLDVDNLGVLVEIANDALRLKFNAFLEAAK